VGRGTVLESEIRRKYIIDSLIITVFIGFTLLVLLFVGKAVYGMPLTPALRTVALIACLAVGIFSTSALIAVLSHLRRNCDRIYREDILAANKIVG
jgi:hypothetical protein